ncbi:hypothetical protein [Frankia sp. Cppng1_Ct_nod]|uniref:hypothetical protein n=1 Tax=Frankia sp. Cppng1_Ct_nod TaxID=2897162 RepID=UPI001585785F|nr:hypothetical protein [Frankia sp. Cppng1_Ct_nod]
MSLRPSAADRPVSGGMLRAAGFGSALCVVVTVVHLQDQSWFSFAKEPAYVQAGYVLLEVVGLTAAVLLVTRPRPTAWLLAASTGVAPLVGYILSRGPGLPDYTDDRGNWGEPLGVVSLVVEGLLVVVAGTAVLTSRARARARPTADPAGQPRRSERHDHPSDAFLA